MENTENVQNNGPMSKSRHGCVTAWFILIILVNSIAILGSLFGGDMMSRFSEFSEFSPVQYTATTMYLLAVLQLLNIIFTIMLFNWKKWAFWGFVATAVISIGINISAGMGVGKAVFGLIGVIILWAVLQIKKDEVSAWDNLA